ncbi:PREDICTED: zinc finger protein DZIP1L [Dipodomys ordii]|uniref:Zinc finger protein DZIP1L n=1 Tax=Dipodomys ordii TaxID=10020 RepID=A0A1S3GMM3_DIPOR|nr:PREDICTED: zinc finger protein DZIP1L [Dipodomys ordii]
MQSPVAPAEGLGSGGGGGSALPAFKFQPRRGSLDWRRISALDVERVARELDVAALQENIASVTFCDLGREACSRCGHPVDPALLKVLRLAQLTIEYLLHCQDCLSASVAQLEARLQASLGQQQRGQQELGRQADELKGLREESRRRRKMINTLQQLLLQTGAHSYHPCHLCDKTFMNATFLRGHLQRRHAGLADGRGGGGVGRQQQQQQERPLEEALEELRAKLKDTQAELEAQREAERQRQQREVEIMRQREMEAKKEFEEWKEKERSKFYGEIDKLKQLFWDEFKVVANQNSTLEEKTEWKRKMKQLHRERSAERREPVSRVTAPRPGRKGACKVPKATSLSVIPAKGQQRAPAPGQTRPKSRQPAEPPSTLTTTPTPRPRPQAASPATPATPATPGLRLSSTPPFSSPEEDSGEDGVQQMAPLPPRAPSRPAPPPQQVVDWSDTDFSEEEEDGRGSGGLASSGTLVQSLVRSLQKQLEAPAKKPAGGVSVFSRPQSAATVPTATATAGGGRQLSEEESELELSSLEDLSRPHSPPHASPPERGHPGPRPWGPHRVPAW